MSFVLSAGHAEGAAGEALGRGAAEEARRGFDGSPRLGVVFATSQTDLSALVRGAQQVLGGDLPLIGCSTAGEFTGERVSAGGVALALLGGEGVDVAVGLADGLRKNTPRAVATLSRALRSNRPSPVGEEGHRTAFLLCDGLAGNGEGLVDELAVELGGNVAIAGGAAGDDAAFQQTKVFLGDRILEDAVVAAEVTSPQRIGIGVNHGWCAASAPGTVTAAEGGRLIAIDDRPAIRFYEDYAAARGIELTPENRNQFVFTHELGIVLMNNELKVRAPLSVNDDGSINCATEVPVGQQVRIVVGDHDVIVAAAKTAALNAVGDLGGRRPAGAIVFDCVARKMVLGDGFRREVDAFRDVIQAPLVGFNTYGEIARVRGQLSGFHNTTAVVAVFPS